MSRVILLTETTLHLFTIIKNIFQTQYELIIKLPIIDSDKDIKYRTDFTK